MPRQRTHKTDRALPKILSREDCLRLLQAPNPKTVTGYRDLVALLLLYRCGLRISELCNLSRYNVKLDEGYILVQDGKGGVDRTVNLDAQTIEYCHRWLAHPRRPQSDWFVCNIQSREAPAGSQTTRFNWSKILQRYGYKANVWLYDQATRLPIHPHTLRHCYATERLEDGFSLPEVQAWMGHSDISVTAIYLHVRPTALRAKMGLVPALAITPAF